MSQNNQKKTTHSKLDLFPKEDKVYTEKDKELQELMFNNKSANRKKKNKDYFKNKGKK